MSRSYLAGSIVGGLIGALVTALVTAAAILLWIFHKVGAVR